MDTDRRSSALPWTALALGVSGAVLSLSGQGGSLASLLVISGLIVGIVALAKGVRPRWASIVAVSICAVGVMFALVLLVWFVLSLPAIIGSTN